ncbi:hypothetical protein DL89DRAFT_92978 [Linderina pennispora]|uniref:Uncharacterized protein n=1 Tax=Linderina pennispora TaxID=61395 RepID=A0A1Y1VX32_9FUNG|nr:uncharacterized protein DL89DRAFT_92978 [Linderina pennispora]ORX65859.1 hypothetical protein DL89DRAFT_92978 [Linderina pennispora]
MRAVARPDGDLFRLIISLSRFPLPAYYISETAHTTTTSLFRVLYPANIHTEKKMDMRFSIYSSLHPCPVLTFILLLTSSHIWIFGLGTTDLLQ